MMGGASGALPVPGAGGGGANVVPRGSGFVLSETSSVDVGLGPSGGGGGGAPGGGGGGLLGALDLAAGLSPAGRGGGPSSSS